MATIILTTAVSALAIANPFVAVAAAVAAAAVGSFIDSRLFGPGSQKVNTQGPRLNDISLATSSEGIPVKRIFGKVRTGGNLIWITNFREEETTTTTSSGGGKGGGTKTTNTDYTYYVSCAFAFCEGAERLFLGRVWADGRVIDLSTLNYRFYSGSDTQNPDAKIEATEGVGFVPAFRGICYLVFEDLELTQFGNRIPQINVEINNPLIDDTSDSMENLLTGINLIPATGEAVYGTVPTVNADGDGNVQLVNAHLSATSTDFALSMEDLVIDLPNVNKINLVVSWFGTNLECGTCKIEPRVESTNKDLEPQDWYINGLFREDVNEVSTYVEDGVTKPAFGGTPADYAVAQSIIYCLDVSGHDVYFYPFILMDIPTGNGLPDPYGGAEQAVYPWRGRITSSNDNTAACQTDIDAFFGSADYSDFNVNGTTVEWIGDPNDFGIRRMILHYAYQCAVAAKAATNTSKFKGFYVGTEMVGITRLRTDVATTFPGVTKFNELINSVKGLFVAEGLPDVEVSYAADWSEYHSYRPTDGSGNVYFNMDEIWSNPNCAYIAIDNYLPLSDWRTTPTHQDLGVGTHPYGYPLGTSELDIEYLKGQVEGGEYYHYFYADETARNNQSRTTIEDLAHLEPWVYRNKDLRNWWLNTHHNRLFGGASREPGSTAWTPGMKKIVFSEFGCPAVHLGTNQPNVFYDPKSSESFLPYFSNGERDDTIQRAYYKAILTYWRDNTPSLSGLDMLSLDDMFAWTWDARPYPLFPARTDIWSDGVNYYLGHWLNGRAGTTDLEAVIRAICSWVDFDLDDLDTSGVGESIPQVKGYIIEDISTPRDALASLSAAYLFDGFESNGKLFFKLKALTEFRTINPEELVLTSDDNNSSGYSLVRMQDIDLPKKATITYIEEDLDLQTGSTGTQKQVANSTHAVEVRLPISLAKGYAKSLADIVIQEAWARRETISLKLPYKDIKLDPGDGIAITLDGRLKRYFITGIEMSDHLAIEAESTDPSIYNITVSGKARARLGDTAVFGRSKISIMNLPLLAAARTDAWKPVVAGYQNPFPSALDSYVLDGNIYYLQNRLSQASSIGELVEDLSPSPHSVIDEGSTLKVRWFGNVTLSSIENNAGLGNQGTVNDSEVNLLAVQTDNNDWEIIKFLTADFQGDKLYHLSDLVRGLYGSYAVSGSTIHSTGNRVILLNEGTQSALNVSSAKRFSTIDVKSGANTLDTNNDLMVDTAHYVKPVGEAPLPVADIVIKRNRTSYEITWKRQDRNTYDNFDSPTVPLSELTEQYRIDIWTTDLSYDPYDGFINDDGILVSPLLTTIFIDDDVESNFQTFHPLAVDLEANNNLVISKYVSTPYYKLDNPPQPCIIRIYQVSSTVGLGYAAFREADFT